MNITEKRLKEAQDMAGWALSNVNNLKRALRASGVSYTMVEAFDETCRTSALATLAAHEAEEEYKEFKANLD